MGTPKNFAIRTAFLDFYFDFQLGICESVSLSSKNLSSLFFHLLLRFLPLSSLIFRFAPNRAVFRNPTQATLPPCPYSNPSLFLASRRRVLACRRSIRSISLSVSATKTTKQRRERKKPSAPNSSQKRRLSFR